MNRLQVVDAGGGLVRVAWARGGADVPRSIPQPLPFADPMTADDRRELRWYLEEYLQFPYGAEQDRAARLEGRMATWGEALFRQVFAKAEADPDARAFYQEAVREGMEQCELCVSSEDSAFLNVPWELLRDPTPGRGYLAPSLGGLYRQRTGQAVPAPPQGPEGRPPGDRFRILLVVARPYGERDVPLGTVARPVLEALRPLRDRIDLEVLRPPTFDALQRRLTERRGAYDLVHFDGHGVFARREQGRAGARLGQFRAVAGQGHLVFESEAGGEQVVSSEDLGQALATCRVPLFVLNACQSAEQGAGAGADPFGSVAARLVATGARGVVAMSYSVYATAAAKFMERFYEQLVAHASVSEAVAHGRRRLHAEPAHESPVGPLELRDWLVPALYQQEYGYVPVPAETEPRAAEPAQAELALVRRAEEAAPAGRFGFIGRDYDLLRIERALRDPDSPWVLLTGVGGTGKTELALGFARWYAETGGCPGGVFVTSFKEKADLAQVVGSIAGYGTDFSRLSEAEQERRLVAHLREQPCLLVWDNLEPVVGYPDGATPLASAEERTRSPRAVIDALQHRIATQGEAVEDASIGYAFAQLSARCRTHLPLVGLFASAVQSGMLALFVSAGDAQQAVYAEVVGEAIAEADWQGVLDEAARAGLLRPAGGELFELPPTLPPFLRSRLETHAGAAGLARLDAEFLAFYAGVAIALFDKTSQADPATTATVQIEEANLLRALRLAEMSGRWAAAQALAQTLGEFLEARGRASEWAALRNDLLQWVGRELQSGAVPDQADLWMYLLGNEANDALRRNDLTGAEAVYHRVLDHLSALQDAGVEPKLAVGYHQLGLVAQRRRRYDEAEAWYRKALAVFERLGHPPLQVNSLAQLGVLRRAQDRATEAVACFGQALIIAAEIGMQIADSILLDLARTFRMTGEEPFAAAWRDAFADSEPPLEAIREALKRLDDGSPGTAPGSGTE